MVKKDLVKNGLGEEGSPKLRYETKSRYRLHRQSQEYLDYEIERDLFEFDSFVP